jgi:hypothetical protein
VSINSLGKLTDYEKSLVAAAVPELATNIEKASTSRYGTSVPRLTQYSSAGRLLHLGLETLRAGYYREKPNSSKCRNSGRCSSCITRINFKCSLDG